MAGPWSYPTELLEPLRSLGVSPAPETPPALARTAVDGLYKYELRRARTRLRMGEFARAEYFGVIVALRKKYWMLTLSVSAWERICEAPTVLRPPSL